MTVEAFARTQTHETVDPPAQFHSLPLSLPRTRWCNSTLTNSLGPVAKNYFVTGKCVRFSTNSKRTAYGQPDHGYVGHSKFLDADSGKFMGAAEAIAPLYSPPAIEC